jgi:hypothetical protein
MKSKDVLLNYIFSFLKAAGIILIILGFSTSDYHTIVLHEKEPAYVWGMIITGAVMLVFGFIYSLIKDN